MKPIKQIKQFFVQTLFAILVVLGISATSWATTYYVDPDCNGGNGSASAPWSNLNSLNTTAWNTINSALASDDVTVYFSAREAGSDIDEVSTTRIAIRRTDTSTHRLTLDGMSKYNTNNTNPSWSDYSGSSRYKITNDSYSIESGINYAPPKQNYVTVRGFICMSGSSKAFFYWGGDHILVENNTFVGNPAAAGCLVQFEYAHRAIDNPYYEQNGPGNGGCTDITFRNNVIHDSPGEGLYIGGSNGMDLPGHSYITVENNLIYNTGIYGGEGDGIDIKDMATNVVVRNNVVHNATGGSCSGIISHSPALIEHNVVYNIANGGILLNDVWGDGFSNSIIRYNIAFNNGTAGIALGISDVADITENVVIEHNTIVGNATSGIHAGAAAPGVINGLVIKNNLSINNQKYGMTIWNITPDTISHNDVYNNLVQNYNLISDQTGSNGNISEDPIFFDINNPKGSDGKFWTNDDGLRLFVNSPARNASMGAYDIISSPKTFRFFIPPEN